MNRLLKSMCAIALAIPALAGEITVTGKGSVSLPPDKMKMTFEVSAIDLDIAAAKRTFKERTAILSATLAKVGVATNEVLTSGMDMESVKEYEGSRVVKFMGYRFSEEYTFVAKIDRARIERLYTALVDCKCVEKMRFWFELFDNETPRQEARAQAVGNAREIAAGIAQAAGVRLGEIEEIEYSALDGFNPRYIQTNCFADYSEAVSSVGALRNIEISESVRIKWKIK